LSEPGVEPDRAPPRFLRACHGCGDVVADVDHAVRRKPEVRDCRLEDPSIWLPDPELVGEDSGVEVLPDAQVILHPPEVPAPGPARVRHEAHRVPLTV